MTGEASSALQADDGIARESRTQGENGEGRRRSRDRYGRDRRERGERPARDDAAPSEGSEAAVPAAVAEGAEDAPRRPRYPTGFVSDANGDAVITQPAAPAPVAVAPAPVQAPADATPAHAVPARTGLPRVQGYTLPLEQLQQVAQGSGLQWVNSDAEKVAAVRAAIAAEPKPVHVPRERPAPVVIDEGPLVLVETRRDLGQVKLPFEASQGG